MQHQCSLFTPVQNASEKGFVCNDASISRAAALCLFMLFAKRTNNEIKLNSFLARVVANFNKARSEAKLKRTKRPKLQQITAGQGRSIEPSPGESKSPKVNKHILTNYLCVV